MCKKGLVKYDAAHIKAKIATTTYSLYYSHFFLRKKQKTKKKQAALSCSPSTDPVLHHQIGVRPIACVLLLQFVHICSQ